MIVCASGNDNVILPKVQVAGYSWTCMHLTYMWLCIKWHGVHRISSFMWHQPCQRCKYTTFVDIQKLAIKKAVHSCRITCEHNGFAWDRRIALYKRDQQQQQQQQNNVWMNGQLNVNVFTCDWMSEWSVDGMTVTVLHGAPCNIGWKLNCSQLPGDERMISGWNDCDCVAWGSVQHRLKT